MAYAAGLEASFIYATKRGWDTTSIDTDAESSEGIKMTNKLIEVHKKQSERDQLITTVKERARKLLNEEDIWSAVCEFAHLIIQKRSLNFTIITWEFIM
jgi:hypothetical protein